MGKTTVSAVLARSAALAGLSTLIVGVDGESGLPALFGQEELTEEEKVLSPGNAAAGTADVRARSVTPDTALMEYLQEHGMSRISRRLASSGALDILATSAPGIKDILVLGKLKQLERTGAADLVVLDAPAAGHAITFLQSARGLVDAVRAGPIHAQARDVLELLEDHRRCQVVLVTLPEETPVNEVVETAYLLEDRVGVGLGPVVVNGVYPDVGRLDGSPSEVAAEAGVVLGEEERERLAAAAAFRWERTGLQRDQIRQLRERLPLPQLRLPFLFTTALGPDDVDELAAHLLVQVEALDGLSV